MATPEFTACEAREYQRKSSARALVIFATDVAVYLACAAGALLAPYLWLRLLLGVLTGLMAGLLFVVGHDCCHQSFTPSRRLNRVLGTICFLPTLHPYSLWDLSHNRTHHRYTNQRGRDYVWEPLSFGEYRSLGLWKKAKYRFYRSPMGHLFYNLFSIWCTRLFLPSPARVGRWSGAYVGDHLLLAAWLIAFTLAQCLVLAAAAGTGLGTAAAALPGSLIFTLVVPFLFFHMLFSAVIFLHHTHPRVRWAAAAADVSERSEFQLSNAVHVIFPGPVNFVFHWIMEHTAHHLRPGIPLYHLPEAQRVLERRCPQVIVHRWSIRSHLDILRNCKLYDTDIGVWTDYAGRSTSPGHDYCRDATGFDRSEGAGFERAGTR